MGLIASVASIKQVSFTYLLYIVDLDSRHVRLLGSIVVSNENFVQIKVTNIQSLISISLYPQKSERF